MRYFNLIFVMLFCFSVVAHAQDDISAYVYAIDRASHALEESPEILKCELENLPVGMPCDGEIKSPFGYRDHPVWHTWKHHNGIDISNSTGTPVKATGGGEVVFAGPGWHRGYTNYGNVVVIKNFENFVTMYAHLDTILVEEGDVVSRGKKIGTIGSTGVVTGPHLHYEIRIYGIPVDPMEWI